VRLEGLDKKNSLAFSPQANYTDRDKLKKKSNELIGTRTRDLQTCSIVPQPTTLPRAPYIYKYTYWRMLKPGEIGQSVKTDNK
jgi:hypothetical protein